MVKMVKRNRLPKERQMAMLALDEINHLRRPEKKTTVTIHGNTAEYAIIQWLMKEMGQETPRDVIIHLLNWALWVHANKKHEKGLV